MVVVVIIGILVAIAIPLYNNVTANAAKKAHDANVRTLMGAAAMYVADAWDGTEKDADAMKSALESNYINGVYPTNPTASGAYTVTVAATTGVVTVLPAIGDYVAP